MERRTGQIKIMKALYILEKASSESNENATYLVCPLDFSTMLLGFMSTSNLLSLVGFLAVSLLLPFGTKKLHYWLWSILLGLLFICRIPDSPFCFKLLTPSYNLFHLFSLALQVSLGFGHPPVMSIGFFDTSVHSTLHYCAQYIPRFNAFYS